MQKLIDALRAHRADILLILSLFLIFLLAIIITSSFRAGGEALEITQGGEHLMTVSLAEDGEYKIGEGNILVVKGGEAYMKSADCPDKTCISVGRISLVGESIICLPNRVTVTVVGSGSGDLIS